MTKRLVLMRQVRHPCAPRKKLPFANPADARDSEHSLGKVPQNKHFDDCLNAPRELMFHELQANSPPSSIMRINWQATPLLVLASLTLDVHAVSRKQWSKRGDHVYLPKAVNDYKTATAPNNVTIRYKNPSICETTPGVDSYSGYVDLAPNVSIALHSACQSNKPRSTSSSGSLSLATTQLKILSRCGSMAALALTRSSACLKRMDLV